jgi:hypothetical protein
MLSFLVISPIIAVLLLFWYKTDFILEYGKLFRLNKFLHIDKYYEKKKFNLEMTYYQFIATNYRGFFIRLISCEICLSTWFSIIITGIFFLVTNDYTLFFNIPLIIILSLTYYLIIKKLKN